MSMYYSMLCLINLGYLLQARYSKSCSIKGSTLLREYLLCLNHLLYSNLGAQKKRCLLATW